MIETERKVDRLLDMVKKAQGSGLVYAATRRGCAELANRIRGLGIACEPYHAGLTAPERKRIQQQWIVGTLPVVVATNAFGMGIDKPDCRWVIHHDMPQSLEAYYQEAGRAGRDGQRSYPTLLVKRSDASQTRSRIDQGYPTRAHLQTVYDVTADTLNLAVGSVLDEGRYVTPSAVAERGNCVRGMSFWDGSPWPGSASSRQTHPGRPASASGSSSAWTVCATVSGRNPIREKIISGRALPLVRCRQHRCDGLAR